MMRPGLEASLPLPTPQWPGVRGSGGCYIPLAAHPKVLLAGGLKQEEQVLLLLQQP